MYRTSDLPLSDPAPLLDFESLELLTQFIREQEHEVVVDLRDGFGPSLEIVDDWQE